MSSRAKYLVEKRDGRLEGLRATKLARSLHLAIDEVAPVEVGRSVALCQQVLRRVVAAGRATTGEIAAFVEDALVSADLVEAAGSYSRVRRARRRRRPLAMGSAGAN